MQQLEALVKMKPTKEEEEKLLNYDGDINMLDPAENFVKVLLTIPMAFPRMEVMLYKENFDDEVAHIKMSFAMIEVSGVILHDLFRTYSVVLIYIVLFNRELALN